MKRLLLLARPLAVALPLAALFAQGSLTPPGAPAATMKSLEQIDARLDPRIPISATTTPGSGTAVFVISSPGSYYLTGNLTGVSGKLGLSITADDVEVDLRGFTLTGVAGATGGINFPNRSRIAIRNGIVRNWPGGGIAGSGSVSARLSGLTTELNGSHGIIVGEAALVADCISRGNTGTGSGIIVATRGQILRCLAHSNGGTGLTGGGETQIIDCVVNGNAGNGISFSANAGRVTGCTATSNAVGINHGGSSAIIERCIARSNTGTGINVGGDGVVTNCTSSANADGIVTGGQSLILSNVCASNTNAGAGVGIRVSGLRGRIEGNLCTLNDLGIVTSTGPNLVVRNHCQQNTTNFSLVGTGAGPFVTEANVAANTSPHANFDF
ncbi:MAG: right-handed parallel beta-helix repeat-containing protein [Verrucomicrobia bacterium]|nr:right-handed parallel beta-helix repeat-containing protein [Verrucomicrobiota bacterium]